MQFKAVFLALFVAAATAQDLSGLPECAKPCFVDNFSKSGCSDKQDYGCLCQSKEYIGAVTNCVANGCEGQSILDAREWAAEKCKAAGHPI